VVAASSRDQQGQVSGYYRGCLPAIASRSGEARGESRSHILDSSRFSGAAFMPKPERFLPNRHSGLDPESRAFYSISASWMPDRVRHDGRKIS
jgi:hypothetical protein